MYDVIYLGSGHACRHGAVTLTAAGTWIDFLTLIINKKMTGTELRNMIFAFPTQTYMLVSTLIPLLQPIQ